MNYRGISVWSSYLIATIILYVALVTISLKSQVAPTLSAPTIKQSSPTPTLNSFHLRDETAMRGLIFMHAQKSKGVSGLDESIGSGACILDVNNDNFPDIFLVGGNGQNRFYGKTSWWAKQQSNQLFLNDGQGYFKNVSEGSGLDISTWGMGCNAGDLNNDGFTDIVLATRRENYLFVNLGNGTFRAQQLPGKPQWSTGVSLDDINQDGWLDVYVSNYIDYKKTARKLEKGSGFNRLTDKFLAENYPPLKNEVYINLGKNSEKIPFTNVKLNNVSNEHPVISNPDGRSLSSAWLDINQDSWPDLLVLNDGGSATQLFLNNQGKGFTKDIHFSRIDIPKGTRGLSFGDINNDGRMDIAISRPTGEEPLILTLNQRENYRLTDLAWQSLQGSEKLTSYDGWGIAFIDINNDGNDDLYHGNGMVFPDVDSRYVSQGQADLISLARGKDGTFSKPSISPKASSISSRSVLRIDIDNDGDKDLLITSNNNPTSLLINHSKIDAWVGVDTNNTNKHKGRHQKVLIETNQRSQVYFPNLNNFFGKQDHRVTMALQANETVKKVSVFWQDGSKSEISKPPMNQYLVVDKPSNNIVQTYPTLKKSATAESAIFNNNEFTHTIWKIKSASDLNRRFLIEQFGKLTSRQKIELIQTIKDYDKERRLLGILQLSLMDNNQKVVLETLDTLKHWELEYTYPWLENLITANFIENRQKNIANLKVILSPQVQHKLLETLHHYYEEEEAVVHRKNLAIPYLSRLLGTQTKELTLQNLMTLSETKNIRPNESIKNLLQNPTVDEDIVKIGNWTINKLRRSNTLEPEVPIASILNGSISSTMAQTGNNSQKCITISPAQFNSIDPKRALSILQICPYQDRLTWFSNHPSVVTKNLQWLMDIPEIGHKTLKALLTVVSENPPAGFAELLLTQLDKRTELAHQLILINSIKPYTNNENVKDTLIALLDDQKNNKDLRIAAGNVLIDSYPETVMKYSNDLFN